MSKRHADNELTKINAQDDDDDRFAPVDPVKRASQDVLAGRAIAKPRSLLRGAGTAGKPASVPAANPFAGALGFNANSSANAAAPKNPFAMFGSGGSQPTASSPSFMAPQAATPAVSAVSSASISAHPPATNIQQTQKLKITALNTKFANTIANYAKSAMSGDWTKACQSYISYYQRIADENDTSIGDSTGFGKDLSSISNAGNASNTSDVSMNETAANEDQDGAKASQPPAAGGFKFSGSTADVGFTFGGKVVKNDAETKPSGTAGFLFKPDTTKTATDLPFAQKTEAPVAAASKGNDEPKAPAQAQSAFNFGATADKAASEQPATESGTPSSKFTFGQSNDAPKFNFGNASETKPAFTFGQSSESKPAFAFGQPTSDKPKFTFGASNESKPIDDKPTFSFGQGSDAKPKFSFGQTTSEDKPKFTFGQPADDKPKFNFGMTTAWTPGNQIKFDQPANGANEGDAAENGDGDGDENGDAEPKVEESVDLSGKGPGEENEDVVYEKKSKVYELVNGQYKPVGLGFLRVLVDKETKKSRVLVRADGSGRVLVNIGLRKQLNYTHEGNGAVKILDFPASDKPPVTYLFRVKTSTDGEELTAKLEEVKN